MSLRSLILDHFWLKISSLVLATLIWLAVWANLHHESLFPKLFASVDKDRIFRNLPIMVASDPDLRTNVTINPNHVSVTVRGPASLIDPMQDDDIQVFVRVLDKPQTSMSLPIMVRVPAGASFRGVTPETANVKVTATNQP